MLDANKKLTKTKRDMYKISFVAVVSFFNYRFSKCVYVLKSSWFQYPIQRKINIVLAH